MSGYPTLSIGIGLHRGDGVAGLVGSPERMEFAFIGRTVNVAARVQDLTRRFDNDILVTESFQATLDDRFKLETRPATQVKGIEEPIEIFGLLEFNQ